ncbi:hypothetical protein PIB30_078898 [Stylosanthes scabra]|uniref:BZIP domain-containing protein n=1 Tax=Stylosanthes scabra TaxID=79078 RepID=A0ABU6UPX6_9FABA|nr:hypothetical protein [Stylosanthes scabra]
MPQVVLAQFFLIPPLDFKKGLLVVLAQFCSNSSLGLQERVVGTSWGLLVSEASREVSDRGSARRSRSRKQAHLADLEMQVEKLKPENATLYKEFNDARTQFHEVDTRAKNLCGHTFLKKNKSIAWKKATRRMFLYS